MNDDASFFLEINSLTILKESNMDNQNNDKQGRGNTIFNINHVENLINGDVETLNNTHNEGEVKKSKPSSDDNVNKGNRLQRQMEIMQYVSNLKEFVAKKWQSRYDDLWKTILEDTEVACVIYDPGKQQNTTFNRKLVANIIYIMCKLDVIEESNVTKLTLALEGNKDSSVRGQLAVNPSDDVIKKRVENIVGKK